MKKPFKIDTDTWWFKGCFIETQDHPMLMKFLIRADTEESDVIDTTNTMTEAIKICKANEIKDFYLGIKGFGFTEPLTKRHKTYSLTTLLKGIQVDMVCVTTSMKKFIELCGKGGGIRPYTSAYDLRYPRCNENPDVLFYKGDMGFESMHILGRDTIHTHEEATKLINAHRKIYPTVRDFYDRDK